jgi:hypothetical protein
MRDLKPVGVTLLVLYSPRPEECRRFYQDLGLDFTAERHGQAPEHYAGSSQAAWCSSSTQPARDVKRTRSASA